MLKQLQTIQLKSFVLATMLYLVLLVPSFVNTTVPIKDFGSMMYLINSLNQIPLLPFIIKALILFISGLVLANTVIRNDVIYKHTALPFFFYLLINSLLPNTVYLSSFTLLSFLTVIIFSQVVHFHDSTSPSYIVFKTSVFVGIGSLIHVSFAPIILIVLFAYSRFVPVKFRPLVLLVIGTSFPWLILTTLAYINPDIIDSINIMVNPIERLNISLINSVVLGIYLAVIMIALTIWLNNSGRNTVKSRRIIQIIAFSMLILVVLCIYYLTGNLHSVELLSVPGSLVLAYYFSSNKKSNLRNALFLILILCAFVNQYKDLISI